MFKVKLPCFTILYAKTNYLYFLKNYKLITFSKSKKYLKKKLILIIKQLDIYISSFFSLLKTTNNLEHLLCRKIKDNIRIISI